MVELRGALVRLAAFSPSARRLVFYSFVSFVAFSIFNLIFNLYMSALGFSNDVIGLFNSLPAVAVLLIGLPVGTLADRFGYRAFLLVSGLTGVVAAVALGLVTPRLLAVLAAGTYALSLIILTILGIPMLAQLSQPVERTALYTVNQSLNWVGALLGSLAGGYVPEIAGRFMHIPANSAASLRFAFLAMGFLQAATIPLLARLATAPQLRRTEALPIRLLVQVDWRRFLRILLPQAFLGMAAGMLLNFLQLYLAQRFHLTPGPIGLILAAGALPTAIVSLTAPLISRRLGTSRTIGVFQIIGVPLVLILAFVYSLPIVLIALYLRQFALNIQAPLNQLFGMEIVEERERARLSSAQTVVFNVAFGGLGPLLSGLLQVRGGYELAFSVSAFFYLLAGSTFLRFFFRVRLPSEVS